MRIFQFAFLFSLLFSQYHSSEWSSITSLLTPTDIQVSHEDIVYASTSGGILQFNRNTEAFNFIKMEQGLRYLDLSTIEIDRFGRLWIGGATPRGCLQVYDPNIGLLLYYKEWRDSFGNYEIVNINNIQIGDSIAFAIYKGTTSSNIGILEFKLDEDGLPIYQDYYDNFTDVTITEIHDLDIFLDSVYVTTDQGIFVGNYKVDHLKSSSRWNEVYTGNDAIQFLPQSSLILGNGSIFTRQGEEYCVGFTGNIIEAAWEDDKIGVLTEEYYHQIIDCEIQSFHIPIGDQSEITFSNIFDYDLRTLFTSFDYSGDGKVFIGIKNHGIFYLDEDMENHITYIPNTPFSNEFRAITVTASGYVAATSHLGTLYYNGIDYQHFIPNGYYKFYPSDSESFYAVSLDYHPGQHSPTNIVEKDNGDLIYCNSGGYPGWGTVIELNHVSDIMTKYDNTDNIIDGWYGIYDSEDSTHYMVVKQIEKDKLGNIWVVNPYCEHYGHLLAIQLVADDTWTHVHIPDENSYHPQTIAIEERGSSKRAWIGLANTKTLAPARDYSSGGIKVFKYNDLSFDNEDSTWISIDNPDVLPGGEDASILSIVFDHMGHLWVLSERGVQGYEVSGNNKITLGPLSPFDLLTHIPYEEGNRIRVDSQNNKWIITYQGVWVVQGSMAFWTSGVTGPTAEGLHPDNTGLLSDIVYDVAFDNDKGLAYLATDKGVSILQIPFANNPSSAEKMYISPNPFIVPDDEFVMLKNIPAGSTIQIMTITGVMMKTFELENNVAQALWNGQNDKGEVVGTGVYLVAAHHPTEPNMVSKIAVIRK